jgi:hypothetical protein
LHPAVKGRPEKRKSIFAHPAVLQENVRLHQFGVVSQPFFKFLRGFNDIH